MILNMVMIIDGDDKYGTLPVGLKYGGDDIAWVFCG